MLKEILSSLIQSILPAVVVGVASICTLRKTINGEKDKFRFEHQHSKRETYFEEFIEHCTELICDPEKVFDEQYIKCLCSAQAKVLLYADSSLSNKVIDFVSKCQRCFKAYKVEEGYKNWDPGEHIAFLKEEGLYEPGTSTHQMNAEAEAATSKNKKDFIKKAVQELPNIPDTVKEICQEMNRVLNLV